MWNESGGRENGIGGAMNEIGGVEKAGSREDVGARNICNG